MFREKARLEEQTPLDKGKFNISGGQPIYFLAETSLYLRVFVLGETNGKEVLLD